ncbi:hypothetical protein OG471_00605 [Streptomyces sp. NBC_01336]|uniref:DUF7638 domain-containing protein n=1 Tax=Streptomyces sp. NBC_01336 TaxID=2903829 RepID=UPI002E13C491|nr:hypothetical protein OG471_00605 [Streptomyces sp. NBC_01336]
MIVSQAIACAHDMAGTDVSDGGRGENRRGWCHIWRRGQLGGDYYLDDLVVFADDAITCGERTDLTGLARRLGSGRWAVTNPETPPLPDAPSKWESRYGEPLTPQGVLLEVADRIEVLNQRPTAEQRCWDAVPRFLMRLSHSDHPTGTAVSISNCHD